MAIKEVLHTDLAPAAVGPVSSTHLDVYKRQGES